MDDSDTSGRTSAGRSLSGGLSRGVSRGVSRGLLRGLSRGVSRGLFGGLFAAMLASSLLAGCTETPPPATANGAATATPSATATATASPTADSSDPWALRGVERLVSDSKRLSALVKTGAAKEFLSRASLLPRVEKRTLFFTADKSKYYTEAQAAALPEDARAALKQQVVDEEEYYNTHYGSPLSYSRPLDILFSRGVTLPAGSKYLDFGYGYIGHLRILASMGVECTGVDVWALLPVLYSFPGDQGAVTGPAGEKGSVRLVDGKFPADPAVVKSVGAGYTLITAKNVLKRGYIHPERPVEHPEKLIKLEVSDEVAIKAFHDALAPGGHFLIYNIAPALTPPDKPFVPWSDGRSPFTKAQFEAAGFEVLEFDKDDLPAVQAMAKGLGWDQPMDGEPGMDIQNDLSALYTLVRKPLAQKK